MDYQSRLVLRGVIAAYLVYLGYCTLRDKLSGLADMPAVVAYGGAAAMILGAAAFMLFAIKEYRAGKAQAESSLAKEESEDEADE